MEKLVTCKIVSATQLTDDFLLEFNRYQETKQVWYVEDGAYKIKDDYFIDDWSTERKVQIIQELRRCVCGGGVVVAAWKQKQLVGFGNLESERFGSDEQYLELPYLHVSNDARGMGIGKKLFAVCCYEAKRLEGKKLYIAAHPSIESQNFYRTVGCLPVPAEEVNENIFKREPLDIQLEKTL
ncbi:GNAT family N-acetyltransferase [Fictibacillus nanhaiensis]|uniref:GNAT family N-acetyltransferase n=1 Tax=Fictibacillus nanhaiensis TaxID=742169 RepID=UPI002E22132F|nr:GNAT family N-acetyltransferase [Fictibacillus nanhaiensis]MED1865045.1 GNAT family N-acetyltransferase [Fictibacillus nanhaiensis]